MQEQRKYVRYLSEGKLILKPKDGTFRSISGDLADISPLGIGVYLKEKLTVNTETNFVLIHKYWDTPLVGTGKIKYTLEVKKNETPYFRTGIEFTNITEKEAVPYIIDRIQENIPSSNK